MARVTVQICDRAAEHSAHADLHAFHIESLGIALIMGRRRQRLRSQHTTTRGRNSTTIDPGRRNVERGTTMVLRLARTRPAGGCAALVLGARGPDRSHNRQRSRAPGILIGRWGDRLALGLLGMLGGLYRCVTTYLPEPTIWSCTSDANPTSLRLLTPLIEPKVKRRPPVERGPTGANSPTHYVSSIVNKTQSNPYAAGRPTVLTRRNGSRHHATTTRWPPIVHRYGKTDAGYIPQA